MGQYPIYPNMPEKTCHQTRTDRENEKDVPKASMKS
jgi:hypothetical protein